MKLGFYNSEKCERADVFGSRSLGFPGESSSFKEFNLLDRNVEGKAFWGSYEECCKFAQDEEQEVKAAIWFTDDPGNENAWVQNLTEILHCPIVGGGAVRDGGKTGEGLAVGSGQTGIFFVTDEKIKVHTEIKNIHENILEECILELEDARTVLKINGIDAAEYLNEKKKQLGFAETDFEHITLSTPQNINAHLSNDHGVIRSGRDLEEKMILRYVTPERTQELVEQFYQSSGANSIIFGCAGLKGILDHDFTCDGVGAFLYGEYCSFSGKNDFGNLMLSRIEFEPVKKSL